MDLLLSWFASFSSFVFENPEHIFMGLLLSLFAFFFVLFWIIFSTFLVFIYF
jgi:hypothetical protein